MYYNILFRCARDSNDTILIALNDDQLKTFVDSYNFGKTSILHRGKTFAFEKVVSVEIFDLNNLDKYKSGSDAEDEIRFALRGTNFNKEIVVRVFSQLG